MSEHKDHVFMLKVANVFIWTVLLVLVYHCILFVWPRTPSFVVEPVPLEQNTYKEGELIVGMFDAHNHVDAVVDYERYMKCVTDNENIATGQLNIRLDAVLGIPVLKGDREIRIAQISPMPAVGFNGVCYIEIVGHYKVQLSPVLSKVYPVSFRTADFNVTRD